MEFEPYFLAKWIHILSATVLFGTGLGTAFHMWAAHLRRDPAGIAVVSRNVVLADWLFTTPAGLVQPISGYVLIEMLGLDPMAPGMLAVYGLYILAMVCWIRVVFLQYRIRDLAAAAQKEGTALPDAYFKAMREWFLLGWPAFLALIGIFWIMVTKLGWA